MTTGESWIQGYARFSGKKNGALTGLNTIPTIVFIGDWMGLYEAGK